MSNGEREKKRGWVKTQERPFYIFKKKKKISASAFRLAETKEYNCGDLGKFLGQI